MGKDKVTDQVNLSGIISGLIQSEWDAVDIYNGALMFFNEGDNSEALTTIKDIISEEYVHIGQLEKLLKTLVPVATSMEDGEEEASGIEFSGEDNLEDDDDEIEFSDEDSVEDDEDEIEFSDDDDDLEVEESLTESTNNIGRGYEESLDIDSKVTRKFDKDRRVGKVTKHVSDDVYEVDFPETDKLPGRTDRHYEDDLEDYPDDDIPEDIADKIVIKEK